MANYELPRRGSAPHLCLSALNNIGGEASIQSVMKVRNWRGSIALFRTDMMERLMRNGLIDLAGDWCAITPAGRKYLGIKIEEAEGPAPALVGPRYVAPIRPLNVARHRAALPMREGALDYMKIPSRMGVESINYKGAACFTGDGQ